MILSKKFMSSSTLGSQVTSQWMGKRWASQQLLLTSQNLSKNMLLIKQAGDPQPLPGGSPKPIVLLLPWLMSKKKHINKFAQIYCRRGFEVISVGITPLQLLWPVKGSQLVGQEIIDYLSAQPKDQSLLLHGGYLWGECLVHLRQMSQDKYNAIASRIIGQIWDSPVDLMGIPVGVSKAIFPNKAILRNALESYVSYHLRTFDQVATRHYIRSSQLFQSDMVRTPALFLFSKMDPIGTEDSIIKCLENWKSLGVKCYWKCWEQSAHVGHFRKYPEEYIAEIENFLDRLNVNQKKKLSEAIQR